MIGYNVFSKNNATRYDRMWITFPKWVGDMIRCDASTRPGDTIRYPKALRYEYFVRSQCNTIQIYFCRVAVTNDEALGHLVTQHDDDIREFENYAQAINNAGVAVGYAHGWTDENETTPDAAQNRHYYAVVYLYSNPRG